MAKSISHVVDAASAIRDRANNGDFGPKGQNSSDHQTGIPNLQRVLKLNIMRLISGLRSPTDHVFWPRCLMSDEG
jgi:hypothetical protein